MKEIIIQRLDSAICQLYKQERVLIENRTNEETITNYLVGYLRLSFRLEGWDVDSVYNRDGKNPKKDSNNTIIIPDIVIHHRSPERRDRFSPENNLVVVEVKALWNKESREVDSTKLRDMKIRYGYKYSFRIELKENKGELIEIN
jgi:hypothetical protein